MLALAAAADPSGGGAPIGQLIGVALFTQVGFFALLAVLWRYRAGGAQWLHRLAATAQRHLGIPGWAALPGVASIGFAIVTICGATWDIGIHIDKGRDAGPLGTTAHYPLLLGLFGMFLMGVLALGMAPRRMEDSSPVALRVRGVGALPAAGGLLLAGAGLAMLAFPLDDLWHRTFGQDVTLWGPTHIMIVGGTLTAGVGGALLLVEGARSAGRDPFGGHGVLRRPLAALLAGIFLYAWCAIVHEFNWGVPQFRMVWHPLILAAGGAQALVLARLLGGKGGAALAVLTWLPLQLVMSLVIGGPLHTTMPSMPLFLGEVVLVEALGLRRSLVARPVAFGLAAGALVGTLGFAAEYGWSQVAMPLPWEPGLIPEGLPMAFAGALAGGLLGALMGAGLRGELPRVRRPLALALGAAVVLLGLATNAALHTTPKGVTATMALSGERLATPDGGRAKTEVADLEVRVSRRSLTEHANYLYALGWQGEGRYLNRMREISPGLFRTTSPVPIGGKWKLFVRLAKGRDMLAAPVRMRPDPAVDFAGFPARPTVTRTMVFDQRLMQIERKRDAPMWLWTPATLLVLAIVVGMLVLMGFTVERLGRLACPTHVLAVEEGLLIARAERILARAGRREREGIEA